MFQFCDNKTQQRYILQELVNISRKELSFLVDSLRGFLEAFDKESKSFQIPLPKQQIETGPTKSIDNLFAHYYNDIIEHANRQNRVSFRFGNNKSCVFPSKCLKNAVIILNLQKLSNLTIAKFTVSTRTDITFQTSVKLLRAFTIYSTFTRDCRYDKSNFNFFGNVFCQDKICSGILCVHKKTFHSLERSD